MRTLLIAVLGWTLLCLSAVSSNADEAQTIIILDATAQMGAKLGQRRKIDWAKATISAAVSRVEPASSLALWAFGTSPARKCDDTSELVPLQSAKSGARAVQKALIPLQPKAARSPALSTLQSALKAPGASKDKPVSIILLAGTGDDCTIDICRAAGELHNLYPNVKLTVIGAGIGQQAAANYTCAAKAMGGAFTAVKSGTDLDRTVRQALNIGANGRQPKATALASAPPAVAGGSAEKGAADPGAGTDGANAPASTPTEQPAQRDTEEKPVAAPVEPEPNAVLSAALTTGMPPLDAGVTWNIYKVTTTPTGQTRTADTPSWTGGGGRAKVKLPAGQYMARAVYGFASASGEFTVGKDKIEQTISLEAGSIAAEALQAGESQAADGTLFILYRRKTAAGREELGRSSEVPALFHVNAGDYTLFAFAGVAKLDMAVKVEAGKVSVVKMALNVGTLDIKAFAVEGSPEPVSAWHRIYSATSDPGMGAIPLLRIAGSAHRVQLPAGSYRVETIYGNAREESVISVTAGQVTSKTVILNAGEAKVSLPAGQTEKICAVYEAGADHKADPAGRAAGSDISFILRAGLYDLECRGKGAATPAKQAQIRVVAGETQSAKIGE
jgi:hypothetical protein